MKDDSFDTILPAILRRRARDEGNALACAFLESRAPFEPRRMSYADLDRAARAVAAHLQGRLAPGARALLLYPPGLHFIVAFLGCLYAKTLPATVYPPRPGERLDAIAGILADCGAELVLTSSPLAAHLEQRVAEGGDGLSTPLMVTDRLASDAADAWRDPELKPDDLAFLQYTSGSTGDPKGVMVSHRNLISTCLDGHRAFDHTPDSVMVSWLPTFHDMGLIYGVLLPIMVGFPSYLMAPATFLREPFRWLQAISEYRGTHAAAPNFAFELCLKRIDDEQASRLDLSSWRVAANGAETVRWETVQRFTRRFAVCGVQPNLLCPSYGLAEATLKVATVRQGEPSIGLRVDREALESHRLVLLGEEETAGLTVVGCGTSEIGATILIVDPVTERRCAADRVGEIWVASTSVAQGYWRRPELSDKTFCAQTADGEGPFLRTGDLGFFHGGQLFIAGRIKDLVVVRGRNFYSTDIEHTVERVHPALRPGCGAAFGVEIDGEERLVVTQEVRGEADLAAEELLVRIRTAIIRHHGLKPHTLVLLPPGTVPKTSSGKIRRPICRADYVAGRLPTVASWSEPDASD